MRPTGPCALDTVPSAAIAIGPASSWQAERRTAVVEHAVARRSHQLARFVQAKLAAAAVAGAMVRFDREIGGALDRQVEWIAGRGHRPGAQIARHPDVLDERQPLAAPGIAHHGLVNQRLRFERARGHVGDVVRDQVHLAAQRHLAGQGDVGGGFHGRPTRCSWRASRGGSAHSLRLRVLAGARLQVLPGKNFRRGAFRPYG